MKALTGAEYFFYHCSYFIQSLNSLLSCTWRGFLKLEGCLTDDTDVVRAHFPQWCWVLLRHCCEIKAPQCQREMKKLCVHIFAWGKCVWVCVCVSCCHSQRWSQLCRVCRINPSIYCPAVLTLHAAMKCILFVHIKTSTGQSLADASRCIHTHSSCSFFACWMTILQIPSSLFLSFTNWITLTEKYFLHNPELLNCELLFCVRFIVLLPQGLSNWFLSWL